MSMPTPSLKEFAQAIPVCKQTSGLAAVLDICCSRDCDKIVIVSEQQCPVGVVSLRQLILHLVSSERCDGSPVTQTTLDFQKPLSQLQPSVIEPLEILPAQMSLSQFLPYLQELGARSTPETQSPTDGWTPAGQRGQDGGFANALPSLSQSPNISSEHWALVDEQGKFLGLLNSWLLLKFFARNSPVNDWACASEQPQPPSLTQLVQLLEQLPLPLSLQTATGQVLSENLTWRQQIGTSPNLNWVRHTTAAMLDSLSIEPCSVLGTNGSITQGSSTLEENSTTHHKEALAQQSKRSVSVSTVGKGSTTSAPEGLAERSPVKLSTRAKSPVAIGQIAKEPREFSPETCVQHYCAIDTPCMAASVSQRQAILSAPPISTNSQTSTFGKVAVSALETGQQSQERIFSFVKIPLLPSLVQNRGQEGEGERRNGTNHIPFSAMPSWSSTPTPYHPISEATSLPNPLTSNLWLVLAQDTTEQQKATKELAAKNADLVQLNRLKDEFLACISHELKTPLTAVLGLSTLLKDQTLGQLNERQARYARLIYQSGRQLMTVVNDILDLTRMETGQLELMLEPVDIQTVCDRAYAQVQQLHVEKEQDEDFTLETHFSLEIEPDLDTLVADELRLRQMLVHLLSNALKFTNPGAKIGLRVNRWEGWLAFTVWDTGIGIPPEKQHLIFQKFQQLEQPLTRRHDGTGLGLVLTQHLARLHGGDISFISKLGEGSQFTVLLPSCPPQGREQHLTATNRLQDGRLNVERSNRPFTNTSTEQSSYPQPTTPSNRNRLVLVVETVPRYLERLTEQLKNLAYRVVVARSGTEAIEKARTLQPYAILLNPLLPKLSGWDVLTLLKSDAETRHIPVLVTATQAEKQQAYHHKADGFLSLPVEEHALLHSLTNLGERSHPVSKGLTILHLKPDLEQINLDSSVLSSELTDIITLQHSELNCRVLEADDLDQAELLSRVWHPDLVLLDGAGIGDPMAYLKEFSLHTGLTSLPLVTLDHQITEAANQIPGLCVYPCLAVDNSLRIAALLQVLQVAAGMSRQPSILVMDIGDSETKSQEIPHPDTPCSSSSGKVKGGQGGKSKSITPLTPHSSWLQALNQYLQTAGFRSVLSCSWTEVYRQLQDQDIDLLLVRLRNISDFSALVKELISLAQLPNRPPLLILDHRLKTNSASGTTWQEQEEESRLDESAVELELLLRHLSTEIMQGSSQSMSQLLDRIYQTLTLNS